MSPTHVSIEVLLKNFLLTLFDLGILTFMLAMTPKLLEFLKKGTRETKFLNETESSFQPISSSESCDIYSEILEQCLEILSDDFTYRFLATEESYAHPLYKRKLVELSKTEYTNIFGRARWPGAPQRVLKTPFFMDWRCIPSHENETNQPVIGHSIIHSVVKISSFLVNTILDDFPR